MSKKIFTMALAMLMFVWAGTAQVNRLQRSDMPGKLTSSTVNQKLGNLPSNPLKPTIATKDANTVATLPWSWDFSDSIATANTWTTTDSTTAWTYYSEFGNNANGCIYANAEEWMITPAIAIPATATDVNLSFYIYGYGYLGYPAITIFVSTTGNAFQNFDLNDTVYTASSTGTFERHKVDLSAYAGDTIYIAFVCDGFYSVLALDDVKVAEPTAPEYAISGPYYAQTGIENIYTAVYFDGDTTQTITYAWSSAIGTITGDGETATVTYANAGTDTITLITSNSYGSDTAIYIVNVISCEAISTFPWTEDFEGESANCWSFVTENAIDPGFVLTTSDYANSGYYSLWGNYSDDINVSQYAISPAIVVPAQALGLTLEFYVYTTEYDGVQSEYEVLLSNGGTSISDFTTVLMTETGASGGYVRKSISLDDYAGQTIRIAFHNKTAMGGDVMLIDDVNIHQALNPVFTIAGPEQVMVNEGPATFTATYVEGDMAGMTYSWTSSMVAAGQATISGESTTTATITYTAAGTDHVTFTATNSYGTTSESMDVTVIACYTISTFPYVENFEDNANLACWKVADADGDGGVWFSFQGADEETGAGYGHNSNGAAFSASYDNNYGPLTPDNWLIGPAVDVPAGSNLEFSWYAKGFDPNYADEHYSVYISTTGNTVADFTEAAVYSGNTTGDWVRQNVSLAAYAGQTIHFAFRHHESTDQFYLVIDDVQIAEPGSIVSVRDLGISIYPNPASDMLRVEGNDVRMVELFDLNGRAALTVVESNVIDLSGLADGVYMVRVTTPQGVATEKVVKR